MSPKPEHRPRAVTFAAVAVVILGVLVLARAFDALGGLGSLTTQKALREALDSDSARSLGVTVAELTDVLHVMILIGAAATGVSVVMALFAVGGHRGARWGLLVSGLVGGFGALMFDPLLGLGLAAAAGWASVSPDATAWFSGHPPVSRPTAAARRTQSDGAPPNRQLPGRAIDSTTGPHPDPQPDPAAPADRPPPTEGFGAYRSPVSAMPVAPAPERRVLPAPGRLPASVLAGVLLSWVASLAALVATIGGTVALLRDRAPMVTWAIHTFDLTGSALRDDVITAGLALMLVLVAAWAVVAGVITLFVQRGNATARMLLVMDAIVAVAGALAVLTSASPSGIAMSVSSVVIVAATAVAVLLLSPSAAAYYGDRRSPDRPAPPTRHDDEDDRPPLW